MSAHKICCIVFGLWSGIAGIVALTLNDKSQCAQSYDTLRVIGIGLIVFSICFFVHGFFFSSGFLWLVGPSEIFVFVLECMLIDEVVRGNESEDCSGARGTPRLFMIWWSVPLALFGCVYGGLRPNHDGFYNQPSYAEFKLVL